MQIGDIEIKGHVVLGPMAGITTLAYREFMKPFGVGLSVSEMISDCGIDYGNHRTIEYLATSKLDRPVALQLFGSKLEHTLPAIKYLEEHADYDILDLNFGCPVLKVTKTGAGSAWLKDPQGLYEYVKEIVKASHKPVTAKIRLGWDEQSINVFEVTKLLEKAGVAAICVHCRTKAQGYAGVADYQAIKGLREQIKIPLIISGDINSPEAAKKAIEITGADAVMVARGGVGNPKLITQINDYLDKGSYDKTISLEEQIQFAKTFAQMLIDQKGEYTAIHELRGILTHFFTSIHGSKEIRQKLSRSITNKKELMGFLDNIVNLIS